MKKYLLMALAALGFVACENESENLGSNLSGELEQSYIAISLASAEMGTRATDAVYEDGSWVERKVNSAYVFFFTDGEPFTGVNNDGRNYQSIANLKPKPEAPEDDNVSDITNKVLVINSYNGELPNEMVAVLNWEPTEKTYSLNQLKEKAIQCKSGEYFVMSNSVYRNAASEDVYATPLAYTDFKNSAQEATEAPVQIYVERVAAKVQFSTPGDLYDEGTSVDKDRQLFKVQKNITGSEYVQVGGKDLYARILGWELYQEGHDAYLLKNLDPSWNASAQLYGFWWNDPANHRSYWAKSQFNGTANETFDGLNATLPTHMYCCENTNQDDQYCTKVIVSAQLEDENGNIVPVARWFGHDYVGKENLLTAVQNTLSNTYYYLDGTTYKSITVNDITNVKGVEFNEKQHETYFQLSTVGQSKCWYKRNGGEMVKLTDDTDPSNYVQNAINSELKTNIQPAIFYDGGRTYYFTDIKHLGTSLGVVRNHIYDVKITSITGMGTPVLSNDNIIETPEVPNEVKETFLAAQINILSWRVVDNTTGLQ